MTKFPMWAMVLVFIASVGLAVYTFDFIGMIDVKNTVRPWLEKIPIIGYTLAEEQLTADEYRVRELERLLESINEKERQLANKEIELSEREKNIISEQEGLDRRQREIREAELRMQDLERRRQDKEQRLSRLANIYMAMPPEAAAKQLEKQDDELVIEILNRMKEDIASLLISQMAPDRATNLILKMGRGSTLD